MPVIELAGPPDLQVRSTVGTTLLMMPVAGSNRVELDVGVPISSFACTKPSAFASFQQDGFGPWGVHAPLDWFEPQVSDMALEVAEAARLRDAGVVVVRAAGRDRGFAVAAQVVTPRTRAARSC